MKATTPKAKAAKKSSKAKPSAQAKDLAPKKSPKGGLGLKASNNLKQMGTA